MTVCNLLTLEADMTLANPDVQVSVDNVNPLPPDKQIDVLDETKIPFRNT